MLTKGVYFGADPATGDIRLFESYVIYDKQTLEQFLKPRTMKKEFNIDGVKIIYEGDPIEVSTVEAVFNAVGIFSKEEPKTKPRNSQATSTVCECNPEPRTTKSSRGTGQIYRLIDTHYIISLVDGPSGSNAERDLMVAAISVNGNRYNNPVQVEDMADISEDEFSKILPLQVEFVADSFAEWQQQILDSKYNLIKVQDEKIEALERRLALLQIPNENLLDHYTKLSHKRFDEINELKKEKKQDEVNLINTSTERDFYLNEVRRLTKETTDLKNQLEAAQKAESYFRNQVRELMRLRH